MKTTYARPYRREPLMNEDRGLLTSEANEKAYFAFITGGLFGVWLTFAIPEIVEFFVR
jgi:hypothetical protein